MLRHPQGILERRFTELKEKREGFESDSFRFSSELSIDDPKLHVKNAVIMLGQFASSIGCKILANAPNLYVVKHI